MMKQWLRPLMPTRASSQLIALLLLSVLFMHVVMTIAFMSERDGRRHEGPTRTGRIAAILQMADAATPEQRQAIVELAQRTSPEFALKLVPPGLKSAEVPVNPGGYELSHLREALGPNIAVIPTTDDSRRGPEPEGFVVRLRDGEQLTGLLGQPGRPPFGGPLWLTLVFLAISIVLLGTWSASQVTAPLRALARSAESYSLDGPPIAFTESGPSEIRAAAGALNQMQHRITLLVAERTRMLAAVSHDLRTPITRLRLRAEFMQDETARNRTLIDLDQMEVLVTEALSYLRNGSEGEAPRDVDLASLVHTIADRFTDLGTPVSCSGVDRLTVCVKPLEIDRAITNLVENALRYAGAAEIGIGLAGDRAIIDVMDDGPGIPAEMKAEVLEAFVRGDAARTMEAGSGMGLGLTIARAIAAANGGRLTLLDRQPRGLIARMELPLAKG